MKLSSLLVFMLNSLCTFSEIAHEIDYFVGCSESGTTVAQYDLDEEEIMHVNFERREVVYTIPRYLVPNPSELFDNLHVYNNALKAKRACPVVMAFLKLEEKHPAEAKDPPETTLYPSEEVELGVENSLICFVNQFYPPFINVSWTKNDLPVSEGVSQGQYSPTKDQTFYQFSTLRFTPSEGDIYSCTVEHVALDQPLTRFWESDFSHRSLGPDIYCGVGLTVGLLGVAVGTFLMVRGHEGH